MIPLPLKPKVKKIDERKSVFQIEALYPGYGITIGNSLRRILISSLRGAAITQVKIKGVPHEFSTINGVLEDAIIILLNLKKLRFKVFGEEPQVGFLKVNGKKEARASSFKLPSQVELISQDLPVATLTSAKSSLEMEIKIEKGIGYEPAEKRKREKLEIGVIPLDAIYTPIVNVAFRVENMRVGERTDFDRLILEIETDGTISPEEAFITAGKILMEHLASAIDIKEAIEIKTGKEKKEKKHKGPAKGKKVKTAKKKTPDLTKMKIEDLGLTSGMIEVLADNKIKSIAGLVKKSEANLLEIKGLGPKAIKEIKKALRKSGLNLEE